jgi:cell division protein FtsQ
VSGELPAPGGPSRGKRGDAERRRDEKGRVTAHERMIERRQVVARAAGRRRLRIVVVAVGLVVLVAALFGLAHSPLISARTVTITGAVRTTRAEILAVSGLGGDPPLIDVDVAADTRAIERLPWIKTASVRVSFPSSVRVVVTERRPVAALPLSSGGVALIDATGRVLADMTRGPAGIVSLAGLTGPPAPGGAVRGAAGLLAAAAALPAGLVDRIAVLRSEPGRGIVAALRSGPQVILGTTADLPEKFIALATVLSEVSLQGIATIDLRAPSDPVLTP